MKKEQGLEDGVYYRRVKEPIYGLTLWVLISQSHSLNPCDALLHKHRPSIEYSPDSEALASCMQHFGAHGYEIILSFRKTASISAKVHEAVHAKNYIFKSRGVNLDSDNDEPEAYYIGYIVSVIEDAFEHMDQLNKKKKK